MTPEGAVAFVVRGDSMYPAYLEGSYIIAAPGEDLQGALYRRIVATLADGRRVVKQLGPGSKPGRYTLYSANGPPIPDAEIIAFARVIGTIEPL